MMKSLLLLAIFLPSVFTLLSCTRFQNTELSVYYPSCPSGFKEIMECEYSGMALKVCLETKAPPITVSPTTTTTTTPTTTTTKPTTTTTTTTKPTTTTTTTTTKPTTTTTTTTTKPTTTTTTTTKPTTTRTTTKPTTTTTAKPTTTTTTMPTTTKTTIPTTTLPTTGCGIYPAQGFIFGAKVTTKCQPWLGYVEAFGQIMGSVILLSEDTVLAIQSTVPLYIKGARGNTLPSTFYFGNKKVESTFTVTNTETEVVGENGLTQTRTFVVLKLDKKVTISGCVRPICLPKSQDEYQEVGCRAAIYDKDKDGNPQIEMGDTRLINDSTCNSAVNNTLCAYPFVQTCTGKGENGGMLICPSKSGSRWMLAGLTRDDLGQCTPKKWNEAVHYWDFLKLRANLGL